MRSVNAPELARRGGGGRAAGHRAWPHALPVLYRAAPTGRRSAPSRKRSPSRSSPMATSRTVADAEPMLAASRRRRRDDRARRLWPAVARSARSRHSRRPAASRHRRQAPPLVELVARHYEAMLDHYGVAARASDARGSISAGTWTGAGGAAAAPAARSSPSRPARGRHAPARPALCRRRAAGGGMSVGAVAAPREGGRPARRRRVLDALPHPVILVGGDGCIAGANTAAAGLLPGLGQSCCAGIRSSISCPSAARCSRSIEQVRERGAAVTEYRVDIGSPRNGGERVVDIYASPVGRAAGSDVVVDAAGAHDGRQDRPPAHPSRRGAHRDRPRRHARARDQEPALGHPRRGAAARSRRSTTTTAR